MFFCPWGELLHFPTTFRLKLAATLVAIDTTKCIKLDDGDQKELEK